MELTFKIKKNQEFILDHLTDMQKFVSVHPVITKMDKTGDNSFLVYETLRFLFIPISFTYPVTIESKANEKVVVMNAVVKKMTKVKMVFSIKSEGEFTIVEEKTEFKSPLPIKWILKIIFKKQHNKLFRNIELKVI